MSQESKLEASPFFLDGGALWVDFTNTVMVVDGAETDRIATPESFTHWCIQAGVDTDEPVSDEALETTHHLREALRETAQRTTDGQRPTDAALATIDAILAASHGTMRLRKSDDGIAPSFVPIGAPTPPATWRIAMSAACWLRDGNPEHLKRCAHHECVLFFQDTTRNHSRRWCSMTTCGNRAKSTRFRRRQSAG